MITKTVTIDYKLKGSDIDLDIEEALIQRLKIPEGTAISINLMTICQGDYGEEEIYFTLDQLTIEVEVKDEEERPFLPDE